MKTKMEKRERVNKQILSHNPSQTVGKEGKNQSVLMQSLQWRKSLVSIGECWPVSAETLVSKAAIQQVLQYQDEQNCEKYSSAFSRMH